jgi:hypothetical protein
MWGTSAHNVWATGLSYTETGVVGAVLHFDGKSWKDAPFGDMPTSRVIAASSANDLWFYDESTRVLIHSDGTTAAPTPQQAATHADLSSAWGLTGDDVWAVGSEEGAGRIIHRTAQGWSLVDAGAHPPLYGVFGSAADDVWAVGAKGTVLRFDGKAWSLVGTGVASTFHDVWTSGPDDVWLIGEDNVSGRAVGNPIVLHYDGKIWGAATPVGFTTIARIAGSARDDLWLVGYGAGGRLVLHFDGNAWSPIYDVPAGAHGADAIFVASKNDVWIDTAHFDGTKWTEATVDPAVSVVSIFAHAPNDVWTMSAMGEVQHFDGTRFRLVTTIEATSMRGAGNDVFVLGTAGEILHKAL